MAMSHLLTLTTALILGATSEPATDPPIAFNRDIRPILSDTCFSCHGPDASHRQANLRLDTEAGAFADLGDGYFAIKPGDPEHSEVYWRITSEDELDRMPPAHAARQLTDREVELIVRWIEQGAPYQEHWSFLAPRRPSVPTVADSRWPRGAIDRFLLAPIEAEGLSPSPEADKVTLIRRLSFDLTGLPPTPDEVDRFLGDETPDAYERLVDRLLGSPRYGERMAMYWLDLVRYADTVGYHGDQEHAISPYRDWVIDAFNANLPFDQFTTEQLAGDLLPEPTLDQIIATGYNRVLQTTHEGGAQDKEYRAKYAADRVRNVSTVWMGATLGCAECHDHKYDPYTQEDFYSFAAFFADVNERGAYPGPDRTPTVRAPEIEVLAPRDRAELARIEAKIEEIKTSLKSSDASEQLQHELEALEQHRERVAQRTRLTMITEAVEPHEMRVLPRGDWMDDSGPVVVPAVPRFLPALGVEDRRANRLDLAAWLTSPEHPQTARVFVNRLWYLFFGAGLSRSLEDNGSQGDWPTHPELLDWLAVEFVASGWDIKHVVRLIVTSSAYRQASLVSPTLRERDPENKLFARQGRYRLPAEMIRDNALTISGLLVEHVGGPSARPYQPKGYYAHLNFPTREYVSDVDENQYRRGVYMHWQRQFLHPMLQAFDAPTREECTAQRPISNTPLAALTLLNDPSFVEAARVFAARILSEGGSTDGDRIAWAWRVALSRPVEAHEAVALTRHLDQSRAHYADDPGAALAVLSVGLAPRPEAIDPVELAAWTSLARTILNLSETITRN